MRKLLYILPVLLILGFAACENYVDITPTGKKTVDSTETYYELVALPNRSYYPSSFALLSDNVWSKESNIIGKEYLSSDGINMTFNEDADRKELSDNNLYANCYQYILRSNIVISLVDHSTGDKDVKELAKAEAKIMRAWDHFILVNTFAKAYNPETAATDVVLLLSANMTWKRLLPKLLLPKSMTLSSRISRMRYLICRKNR